MTTTALQALQAELNRCPFHDLLQLEALSADVELTMVKLPFRAELGLARDHEAFHGGVLAALVDIAAHAAVALHVGRVAPTIDLRVDFLRPARAKFVVAEATVLRAGRMLARADVSVRDPAGVAVACGRGTFSTLVPG